MVPKNIQRAPVCSSCKAKSLKKKKIGRNCKIEIDQKKGPERNDRKKKWVMDMRN